MAAARFSAAGRVLGRRQRPAVFQLTALARKRNPAVLSPLFMRPFSSDGHNKGHPTENFSLQNRNVPPVPDTDKISSVHNETASTDTEKTLSAPTEDHNDSNIPSLHDAVHQVEHRAKEKGGIELSRLAAEEAIKLLKRSAERGRALEHAVEMGAERAIERVGERAAERVSERTAERLGERAAERVTEQAAERLGERAAEQMAERAAERVGERAAERMGERTAERVGGRAAERVGERAVERIGERGFERIGERATEVAGRQGLAKGVARPLALTVPERIALRIGRGILIALPALGGIFALYLLKTDTTRAIKERRNGSRMTFMLFGGAAVTDAVDAVCHFAIAYGVFHEFGHHLLAQLEEVSLGCAFISTFCAVMGEVLAFRKRKKLLAQKERTQKLPPSSS